MSDGPAHADLPERIDALAARLAANTDPAVANDVRHLLDLTDELHRTGLVRLMSSIQDWRGEVFLAAVRRDPAVSRLLSRYETNGR